MPAFHYIVMNPLGKKEKGMIEADNAKQARQLLRTKKFIPLTIQPAQPKTQKNTAGKLSFRKSVSSKELALLTRQLATLLTAGLPIEEVLSAVAEQTENHRTKGLILSVRSKVVEGYALAKAMRDFPEAFTNLYCATVAAGEKSGHLDVVLQRLADYTEQQFYMRQKIQHALIYPATMIFVSIGIVGFLLTYVVPKMVAVYNHTGQALPLMTQILISFSEGIKTIGPYFLIFLIMALFLFRRTIQKNISFRKKIHHLLLHIPIIKNMIKTANTARFSRTFAILSSAGVPVLEAMSIASTLITNILIRESTEAAAAHVREGANIHLALKQTTYFPPMSLHLIASGEASGQLENMLERAATNQENDMSRFIETCLALFEPMIILVMGAIVLFIVLAVLLPIFQLDQLTGG